MGVVDEAEGDLHGFSRDDGGLGGDEGGLDVGAGRGGQERGEAERTAGEEAGDVHAVEVGRGRSEAQTSKIVPAADVAR